MSQSPPPVPPPPPGALPPSGPPSAPSTPSPATAGAATATAAWEDDRSPCASCSALNPPTSTFCWGCFGSLGRPGRGPASTMARPMGMGSAPVQAAPPADTDAPSARPALPVKKVVAAVAAFVVGFFAFQMVRGHDLRLPQSVAGMDKIEAPALQPAIDQLRAQAKAVGATGDAAIYGQSNVPSFVVLVIEGTAVQSQDPDALFTQFATGFASSGSNSVDVGHVRKGGDGTMSTYCARTRGTVPGGVCMWVDPKVVGFVFYPSQSVGATQTLTTSVRTDTES